MLEGAFNRKLKKALEAALPDAYIVKHNEMTTGGVPDLSVSSGPITLWIESKRHKENPTKLQWWSIDKLRDGCVVVWFSKSGREVFCRWQGKVTEWMTFEEFVSRSAWEVMNGLTKRMMLK